MRNELLEKVILENLQLVYTGLREETLKSAVELAMDRPDLTTNEFVKAVRDLEDAELISQWADVMGTRYWCITNAGKQFLKGGR